jgi:hypothetical protein
LTLAAAAEKSDVERLVRQLGSDQFAEREAATEALDRLGGAALPALRAASTAGDAEVRRRSERLIQDIEQRLETAELLQPTKIRLDYKDLPLSQILADLSKRAGLPFEIATEHSRLGERRITLSTPELPIWEAFDRLCEAAEVTAQLPSQQRSSSPPSPAAQPLGGISSVVVGESRITLIAGKPSAIPTHYAGAVRLRIVPPQGRAVPSSKGEASLLMEIAVEPRLQWRDLVQLRFDEVRDDKNQMLVALPAEDAVTPQSEEDLMRLQMRAIQQQRIVAMKVGGSSAAYSGSHPALFHTPVRLKLPETAGKSIPVLKGVLTAQVQAPVQVLGTFDDPAQGTPKTIKAKDGVELKLVGFKQNSGGSVEAQLELIPSAKGLAGQANMMINVQAMAIGNARGFQNGMLNPVGSPFTLRDAEGHAYNQIGLRSNLEANNGGVTQKYTVTWQPPNDKAVPKSLVYSGSRLATIEVPFELKDVQLP